MSHEKKRNDNLQNDPAVRENILKLANELLEICHNDQDVNSQTMPRRIYAIDQLKSSLYVHIYENICNTELIDKRWPTQSIEEEIHNVQAVIDSLSMDVLHEDLSHLTGEAICGAFSKEDCVQTMEPDYVSIEYLLDILRCIHEWISSRLESTMENTINKTKSDKIEETTPSFEQIAPIQTDLPKLELCETDSDSSTLQQIYTDDLKQGEPMKMNQINVNGIDDNNNESNRYKHGINTTGFSDFETKKLLHLIDDFETVQLNQNPYESNILIEEQVEDEEDLFKSYMKQKEEEYQQAKRLSQLELSSINKVAKSSSGNSSLSSTSSSSSLVNDNLNTSPSSKRRVTFETKSPRKNSSQGFIQTVNNELKSIDSNLEVKQEQEKDRISFLLKSVYNEDLRDAETIMKESLAKIKNKSKLTNELYLNAFKCYDNDENNKLMRPKSSLTITNSSRSKGVLIPTSRSVSHLTKYPKYKPQTSRRPKSARNGSQKRSSSVSAKKPHDPSAEFISRFTIGEDGILNSLLQEFPYLYTSPETIHYLWQKHSKQIETFAKLGKEVEQNYMKPGNLKSTSNTSLSSSVASIQGISNQGRKLPQVQLQETYKKQQMLMDIMRKDLQHMQRMEDMKRKVEVENSMKARAREQRFQNCKVKRYYEEFRLQQRAKMLKKTTEEELIFKRLFNESLKIQKERMLDLKRYAKEKSELNNKTQLNQIASIENFYKNRFDLMNEKLSKDKKDMQIRDKAQHQILSSLKNQVKGKLESDIRDLQDQMSQDRDHIYWREMDAKRVQSELYKANYIKPKAK